MPLPSIGSLFRPTQQVATPPAPAAPANPNPNAPNQQQQNPGQPVPADQGAQGSPLDAFKTLWDTPANKDGTPVDPLSQPVLSSDPAKIKEAASKIDFMSSIPPETMQKAMSGDFQSMSQIINSVGQQSLAMAAQLSAATVDHAIGTSHKNIDAALPDRFKKFQTDSLASENPVLNHPSAKPMLDMAKKQIRAANPDYSPQQVQAKAEEFLTSFASSLTGAGKKEEATAEGEMDWSTFL